MACFAHSLPDRPQNEWEPLSDHLREVGDMAARFAVPFGWGEASRAAGLLHDIGKTSAAFQIYIAQAGDQGPRGPDHSTAGAKEAERLYGSTIGRLLAYAIAGHHAGLSDFPQLEERINRKALEVYEGWQAHAGELPTAAALRGPLRANSERGFSKSFLIRMLFSCLVDADSLATERFYAIAHGEAVDRGGHTTLAVLRERLDAHMRNLTATARETPVNRLRTEVLAHATRKAELAPGFFTLTVPTGGGKTLASLSFALEHAVRHGLERVIYVIPFTSIIEQTAQVFREALRTSSDVLEHHASFDWDQPRGIPQADSEGPDGLRKLRRAAENWDAPIVVTTAVQFFESLFSNKRGRCRKLHNIAQSIVILDEAQTLPLAVLRPSLAALDELRLNYGSSVVICTATQPAWRSQDAAMPDATKGFPGLDIGPERELAPEPERLYGQLRRVRVERRLEPIEDAGIAERFAARPQMLCIVNSRRHARELFDLIRPLSGAVHLTTLMCPTHRQTVLARIRVDLAEGRPVRLVATSLIEAGVDVDFPEVWRAIAGLESIAQAAGRCNREGKLGSLGRVFVFEPAEAKSPKALKDFWQAARPTLEKFADPLSLSAILDYFRNWYWQRGAPAFDAVEVDGLRGVLPAIRERATSLAFPFASIADGYRLIDDIMAPVVVPYDEGAQSLLGKIAAQERPFMSDLRALQKYVVGIPPKARSDWLAGGALRPVHPRLGDGLLRFDKLEHYDPLTGVRLDEPTWRDAESNVF